MQFYKVYEIKSNESTKNMSENSTCVAIYKDHKAAERLCDIINTLRHNPSRIIEDELNQKDYRDLETYGMIGCDCYEEYMKSYENYKNHAKKSDGMAL